MKFSRTVLCVRVANGRIIDNKDGSRKSPEFWESLKIELTSMTQKLDTCTFEFLALISHCYPDFLKNHFLVVLYVSLRDLSWDLSYDHKNSKTLFNGRTKLVPPGQVHDTELAQTVSKAWSAGQAQQGLHRNDLQHIYWEAPLTASRFNEATTRCSTACASTRGVTGRMHLAGTLESDNWS